MPGRIRAIESAGHILVFSNFHGALEAQFIEMNQQGLVARLVGQTWIAEAYLPEHGFEQIGCSMAIDETNEQRLVGKRPYQPEFTIP
jgi:hypothetical protein